MKLLKHIIRAGALCGLLLTTAASAEPMAKVMEMVRLTSIPMSWAAALSSEQARMALPILLFPVKVVRPSMMTTQATMVSSAT